jgi:hypothetical protein
MYRAIDVWKKNDGGLIRYRCFQILESGKYCVQSADFYYLPIERELLKQNEQQFFELLIASPPDERAGAFDSLEEAIRAHDQDFEND